MAVSMRPVPGVNPLLGLRTPEQTTALENARIAEQTPKTQDEFVLNLAAYVRTRFSEAERHRNTNGVTARLEECQRRYQGRYSPDRLAQIQSEHGNETYFNLTSTKCATAEAWLQDVMMFAGDKLWTFDPTPIPDLSEQMKQVVIQGVQANYRTSMQPLDPMDVQAFTLALYDTTLKLTIEEAKKRTERMERVVDDQLSEGMFMEALLKFNWYFVRYPTAFIKGPILRKRKRLQWRDDTLDEVDEDTHCYEAPNPHNVYPGPNNRGLQDGYVCESNISYSVDSLMAMREAEGWNADAIDRVLAHIADSGTVTTHEFLSGETERATAENREMTINSGIAYGSVQAVEFWGPCPVKLLREWGMQGLEAEKPNDFKEIHGILIGVHMVRAVLNPYPLNERPWSQASYEPEPDSPWGQALPELIAGAQDPSNAAQRAMMDNLAISSGPQVTCDMDAIAEGEKVREMFPWKVWCYNGRELGNSTRKPVDFFQPTPNAEMLLKVAEHFAVQSDEQSRIPRYTHGETNVSGAGETASGLDMLMTAATKGIKRLLGFIDYHVIRSAVNRQYIWNMKFGTDLEAKADAKIRPRGALALLVKQTTQLRRQEFLDRTNNPIDLQIIGVKGRATVLRAVAQALDLPEDKVVPTDEELAAQMQAQAEMDAQQMEEEQAAAKETKPKQKGPQA